MDDNHVGFEDTKGGAGQLDSIAKQQKRLQADQAKYQKQAADTLNKQHKQIADLNKSNATLREDLTKADTSTFNATEQESLSKLQNEIDQLEMKIEYERMRKADIQNKHAVCRVETLATRKAMGGVNITQEKAQAVEKQIKVLENRLDQALVKFNEALSKNKDLRANIDSLREERLVFQRIYKRLETELYEKKKAMADKIEQANLDYEERDHLKQQLEGKRVEADEKRQGVQEEFIRMDRVLETLKQSQQEAKRQQIAQLSMSNGTPGGPASPASVRSAMAHSNPRGCRKSSPNSQNNDATLGATSNGGRRYPGTHDVASNGGASRGNESYGDDDEEADLQSVVDDLKAATGHQDLRLLLENIIKSEEHNFATYNYINNVSTQQDQLDREIAALQSELTTHRGDVERRDEIKQLELQLAATEEKQETVNNETNRYKEVLQEVRELTSGLFKTLGCDEVRAAHDFGTAETTDLNLVGFLAMVERRATALLYRFKRQAAGGGSGPKDTQGTLAENSVMMDDGGAGSDNEADPESAEDRRLVSQASVQPRAIVSAAAGEEEGDTAGFLGKVPAARTGERTVDHVLTAVDLPMTNGEGPNDTVENDAATGREEILSYDRMRERVLKRMNDRKLKEDVNRKQAGRGKKRRQ